MQMVVLLKRIEYFKPVHNYLAELSARKSFQLKAILFVGKEDDSYAKSDHEI